MRANERADERMAQYPTRRFHSLSNQSAMVPRKRESSSFDLFSKSNFSLAKIRFDPFFDKARCQQTQISGGTGRRVLGGAFFQGYSLVRMGEKEGVESLWRKGAPFIADFDYEKSKCVLGCTQGES